MEDKLKNIEKFFELNLEIKNTMLKCAANKMDNYNMDSRMKYGDKLYFALEDMLEMFLKILKILKINHLENTIINQFKYYQNELLNCNYNFEKMNVFYQKCFSNMDIKLINNVKETMVGYTLFNAVDYVIKDAKTINELLHIMHAYILNNEKIYQSMPKISEREILNGANITLYGKENNIAKKIFNNIPVDLDLGFTDIVGLDNKILIMVRDLGHALTLEIDIENNSCLIKYFIPKVCNPLLVNKLKGINKIKEDIRFANGQFECKIDDLANELYDFFSKVPTDNNMFTLGGWYYEEDNQTKR